jgi:hypothetical protein
MEQRGFHWTDFQEILYSGSFRIFVDKIQVSIKYDKNEYFTWRPIYIFDPISLSSPENDKFFRQEL